MNLTINEMNKNRNADIKEKLEINHTFIVPNRFTMSTEREIFETLNLVGATDISVVSFSRLATIYLRKEAYKRCLTREGSILVLKKVVDKLKSKLKRYGKVAESTGFSKEMFAVIDAIRNSGHEPEDLLNAREKVTNAVALKLEDIALLYAGYLDSLDNMDDAVTKLERYTSHIKRIVAIRSTRFYVVGFIHFSAKEKKILANLIKYSKSICVGLTVKLDGENKDLYPNQLPGEIEKLGEDANLEADIKILNIDIKEPFNTINKELFAYKGGTADNCFVGKNNPPVVLYRENTVYDEANRIACEIAYLIKHEGYRYKDIAVINCDPTFIDILTSILTRYKIPYFADLKYPLSETILYNYLIAAIETIAFNFRADKVLKLVKSPMFGVDHEKSCLFENFVIKYNINFGGFQKPFTIEDESNKEEIEAIRSKVASIAPAKHESSKITASEFVEICKSLLTKNDFVIQYDQVITNNKLDSRLKLVNSRARGKIDEILDEINELLNDYSASITSFIETLKAMIAAVQISLIPQSLDSVFVGNIIDSRFNGLKAIFVTGAASGMLPSEKGYFTMITATDSDILADNELPIYPNPIQLMREEEFLLLDIIARVKERLYIGYAASLPNGTLTRASNAFKEICRITGLKPTSIEDKFLPEVARNSKELEDCAISMENAYFQYLATLGRDKLLNKRALINRNILLESLNDEFKERVRTLTKENDDRYIPAVEFFFEKLPHQDGHAISVSQLESYFRCPHLHYLRYGIKLKERETADLGIIDVGNIIHKALENYFRRTKSRLRDESDENTSFLQKACEDSINESIAVLAKKDTSEDLSKTNILARIKKECRKAIECMTNNILRSKYTPTFIEAGFGENQDFPYIMITTSNNDVYYMRGKIDRVDLFEDKAVVIDYKTGGVTSDLKDVYSGVKIQLFAYLNAIKARGYKPIAAFYIAVRDSYHNEIDADYGVVGHVVNYPEMFDDFDHCAYEKGLKEMGSKLTSPNWPFKLEYSKTLNDLKPSSKDHALEEADFDKYIIYTKELAGKALEEIVSGYCEKSPISDSSIATTCSKCTYMRVCSSEGEAGERCKPTPPSKKEASDSELIAGNNKKIKDRA
jgi:ATP-dependent helicase/nuclease subunit B